MDKLLDSVDAMVFSGDQLYNRQSLDEFKNYLERWGREVVNIEETLDEIEADD